MQTVLAGRVHLPLAVTRSFHEQPETGTAPGPQDILSHRELQVLRLLGSGTSQKQIAAQLAISDKTVSTYRRRILTKLGLSTNADLVRYALEHGLLE